MTGLLNIGIEPYYQDKWRAIYHGDCLGILPLLSSVSAVVTDPPYELGFMGKSWDSRGVSFQKETWEAIRSACLPGAPLLSFGGTRTQHRIACAIEDAGWEIRDCVMWVYGQGFPKSLDIGKTIDKLLKGHPQGSTKGDPDSPNSGKFKTQRTEGKRSETDRGQHFGAGPGQFMVEQGVKYERDLLPEAQLWDGWGTALKPAYEPIILAMNPLDKTFANNALKHGVAGLNIDGCRIAYQSEQDKTQATVPQPDFNSPTGAIYNFKTGEGRNGVMFDPSKGRFPANFLHDGSQEVTELFPNSKGQQGDVRGTEPSPTGDENTHCYGEYGRVPANKRGDDGSAARFFYCAKASRSERDKGLEDMEGELGHNRFDTCATCSGYLLQNPDRPSACKCENPVRVHNIVKGNTHPTVKPLALMEYLCKLVKMPRYNLILDPFCGSGTTLLVCGNLEIKSIGIDSAEKSCEIAAERCVADTVERIQKGEY